MVNMGVKILLVAFALIGAFVPVAFSLVATPESPEAAVTIESSAGTFVAKYPGAKSLNSVDCAGEYALKCADCRNIAVCAGEKAPLAIKSCSNFNPAKPYCVNGACSSTVAPDTGVCAAEFRCSSEGYFPHPNDCSKYYFCDKVNGNAYEYSCGENRVYLSRQKSCTNRTNETECETINCQDSPNSFVHYGPHLAYYAFCSSEAGRKETVVYKCPDEDTSEFDMETLSCVYRCPAEGRHFNPSSCASFYECYRSGLEYQAIRWSCPMGFHYNTLLQRCEPGPCQAA
ncbi:unnamed protein product [Hermetia illucens]|uniref:Chitin-binding type-2 domain-containing protein n=1 Tax=Hermetia illucens TaxID=343691 RepID=A0A7R8UYY4_HERIL|nr:uncharacterized protein LOC119656104 [Hermetia illucens]CAD7089577.1 unnamed protein product [Hermetia illucens]